MSNASETAFVVDSFAVDSCSVTEAKTPERRPPASRVDTPVQKYLSYLEDGGHPSPASRFDSPPTRHFKDWVRKQCEQERFFSEVTVIDDDDASAAGVATEQNRPSSSSSVMPAVEEKESKSPMSPVPGNESKSPMSPVPGNECKSPMSLVEEKESQASDADVDLGVECTRYSDDYGSGVASWSQPDVALEEEDDDPVSDTEFAPRPPSDAPVDAAASGSTSGMSVGARLRGLENRSRSPRDFKYGSCPHHGTALRPHIWGPRSVKAGRGALVCSKFWKRDESTNKPCCWYYKEVSVAEAQQWPWFHKHKHNSLQSRFLRAGRHD